MQSIWIAIPSNVHLDMSSTTWSWKEASGRPKSDTNISVVDLNSRVLTHGKPTRKLRTVMVTASIWTDKQSNVTTTVSTTWNLTATGDFFGQSGTTSMIVVLSQTQKVQLAVITKIQALIRMVAVMLDTWNAILFNATVIESSSHT